MAMNDPKTIAKLLRAMACGTEHQASRADAVFTAAADLLDPASGAEPLFYVSEKDGKSIFQRPVKTATGVRMGLVRMGFRVCRVEAGVDAVQVCAILNRGH